MLPRPKENWVGIWGFKAKEDIPQEDGKGKGLVNKCLPLLAGESFFFLTSLLEYTGKSF